MTVKTISIYDTQKGIQSFRDVELAFSNFNESVRNQITNKLNNGFDAVSVAHEPGRVYILSIKEGIIYLKFMGFPERVLEQKMVDSNIGLEKAVSELNAVVEL